MMKTFVLLFSFVLAPPALAQTEPPPPPPDDVQPTAPPPASQPPPPPPSAPPTAQPIEPPQVTANTAPAHSSVPGEWVYTAQYGWVWMPYDRQYTSSTAAESRTCSCTTPLSGGVGYWLRGCSGSARGPTSSMDRGTLPGTHAR